MDVLMAGVLLSGLDALGVAAWAMVAAGFTVVAAFSLSPRPQRPKNCPFTGIYSAAAQAELSQQLPKKIEVITGYEGRMVKKCLQNYF